MKRHTLEVHAEPTASFEEVGRPLRDELARQSGAATKDQPMTTSTHSDPNSLLRRPDVDADGFRTGVWLIPIFGALTLWATFTHQPDPTTEFSAWARFVTTDEFLAKHLLGSILGLALNTLGVASLAGIVLASGRRARPAVWGFALTVVGSSGLIAGFGLAAFAQPAIGNLDIQGVRGAHGVYDDVYGIPTFVTLIGGTVLFSAASVLLARAAVAIEKVPRWAPIAYGSSGPLIGLLGVAVGPLQTLGSLAAIVGGVGIAVSLRPGSTDGPTAGTGAHSRPHDPPVARAERL